MIVFVSSSRLSPYIDYYHQTVLKALWSLYESSFKEPTPSSDYSFNMPTDAFRELLVKLFSCFGLL
jgi:hypothetical protein